jgi:hypothetical protein
LYIRKIFYVLLKIKLLFRLEREIIRFIIGIINTLAIIVICVALARKGPATLITIFYFLYLVREVLFLFVDKKFYAKFYPSKRKKISNLVLTIIALIVYIALLAIGICKIVLKGVDNISSGIL